MFVHQNSENSVESSITVRTNSTSEKFLRSIQFFSQIKNALRSNIQKKFQSIKNKIFFFDYFVNDFVQNHYRQISRKNNQNSRRDQNSKNIANHIHERQRHRKKCKNIDDDDFHFDRRSDFNNDRQKTNLFEIFHRVHSIFERINKFKFDVEHRENSFRKHNDKHIYRQLNDH